MNIKDAVFVVVDTETTGLYNRAQPAGSPMQPHICQLGAQLCTMEGRVVAEMNVLVKLVKSMFRPR